MQRRQSAGRDRVHAAGRPGDAGVVDERIEAAEIGLRGDEHTVDIALVGDVGPDAADLGILVAEGVEDGVGDVANEDPRTVGQEAPRDGAADAARPRRYQHPLAGNAGREVG
jgi:hypothetical protein